MPKNQVPDIKLGVEDPLFITLFPNPDDGSVTVVEPPVMVELEAKHRQQNYANCIAFYVLFPWDREQSAHHRHR